MSACRKDKDGNCCHGTKCNVYQTLDELDFERGIWSAAQCGDLERCKDLIRNKNVNVNTEDNSGYTALHYASRNGRFDVCDFLLKEKAKVDVRTKAGLATPLHRACTAGKLEIVKLLLKHQANPELKDIDGKTALHRAAENQHAEICKVLVRESGGRLKEQVDNKNKLAVDYAESENLKDLLKI